MGFECIVCMETLETPAPANVVVTTADPNQPGPSTRPPVHNTTTDTPEYLSDLCATKCGHMFHRACLDRWFLGKTKRECPSCRELLLPMNIFHVYRPMMSEDFVFQKTLRLTEIESDLPQCDCGTPQCCQLYEIHKTLVIDHSKQLDFLRKVSNMADDRSLLAARIASLQEECTRWRRIASFSNSTSSTTGIPTELDGIRGYSSRRHSATRLPSSSAHRRSLPIEQWDYLDPLSDYLPRRDEHLLDYSDYRRSRFRDPALRTLEPWMTRTVPLPNSAERNSNASRNPEPPLPGSAQRNSNASRNPEPPLPGSTQRNSNDSRNPEPPLPGSAQRNSNASRNPEPPLAGSAQENSNVSRRLDFELPIMSSNAPVNLSPERNGPQRFDNSIREIRERLETLRTLQGIDNGISNANPTRSSELPRMSSDASDLALAANGREIRSIRARLEALRSLNRRLDRVASTRGIEFEIPRISTRPRRSEASRSSEFRIGRSSHSHRHSPYGPCRSLTELGARLSAVSRQRRSLRAAADLENRNASSSAQGTSAPSILSVASAPSSTVTTATLRSDDYRLIPIAISPPARSTSSSMIAEVSDSDESTRSFDSIVTRNVRDGRSDTHPRISVANSAGPSQRPLTSSQTNNESERSTPIIIPLAVNIRPRATVSDSEESTRSVDSNVTRNIRDGRSNNVPRISVENSTGPSQRPLTSSQTNNESERSTPTIISLAVNIRQRAIRQFALKSTARPPRNYDRSRPGNATTTSASANSENSQGERNENGRRSPSENEVIILPATTVAPTSDVGPSTSTSRSTASGQVRTFIAASGRQVKVKVKVPRPPGVPAKKSTRKLKSKYTRIIALDDSSDTENEEEATKRARFGKNLPYSESENED